MPGHPLRDTVFQAAIVDLDGTLVDTAGDFHAALAAAFADLGLPAVPHAVVLAGIGKGSEHLVAHALAAAGAPATRLSPALAAYQRRYREVNGRHARVFPGAAAALEVLRTVFGLRLVCLTNKPGEFARDLLAQTGLAGHFEAVFGGDAFERRKPDPLPVLRACAWLGSAPAHTLVLGDSSNDAEAARGAGCPVVLFEGGYNHGRPLHEAGPDAVLPGWDALPDLLAPGARAAATAADRPSAPGAARGPAARP